MPPRDEYDYEQRRQQIIDGALEVFASKGFHKATNKDIAEAAGIGSPGLIYHYFKDKHDLLVRVVEQRMPHMQLLNHLEQFMDLPPREALTIFGHKFLEGIKDRRFLLSFQLILSETTRHPEMLDTINKLGPGRWLPIFQDYIKRQIEVGTFRRMDERAAARCFVGPLLAYIIARDFVPQPDAQSLDADTMIATAVEIFMQGMEIDASG